MAKVNFERRKALQWMAIGLGVGLAMSKKYSPISLVSKLLSRKDPYLNTDFVDFYHSSAVLLGVTLSSLDQKLAYKYWTELTSDVSTRNQLFLLSKEIKDKNQPDSSFDNLGDSLGKLSEFNHGITKKLLRVWYTGVHELSPGKEKRLVYDESLIFSFFLDVRPTPGNCFGPFGYWTKKPTHSHQSPSLRKKI